MDQIIKLVMFRKSKLTIVKREMLKLATLNGVYHGTSRYPDVPRRTFNFKFKFQHFCRLSTFVQLTTRTGIRS